MPSWAWVVTNITDSDIRKNVFQCPLGLELLLQRMRILWNRSCFNALSGLSCYVCVSKRAPEIQILFQCPLGLELLLKSRKCQYKHQTFQCPLGLELLHYPLRWYGWLGCVSMPSRAWVVTARMSNILNFSWYFLCIPAIYRCILAYLPIFFNQLSKFLRCESPSTFLGTCLSHHSFIW